MQTLILVILMGKCCRQFSWAGAFILLLLGSLCSQSQPRCFKVVGFYTARNDQAHISFVHEANVWFSAMASLHGFQYDSTSDWSKLNPEFLATTQVLVFLDTRPESTDQRMSFQHYMETGGSWMGFHFSAFALNPSAFPQDWDWYHEKFLGSGAYVSNTWRPTAATLRVETMHHPVMKNIGPTLLASPNEWYRWKNDLRKRDDIEILLSIDPVSFPLGTGPKPHEIWHEGYYPVVWSNRHYRMIYFNMGHNDIDYAQGTNQALSHTFGNKAQDQLILQSLLWLGQSRP